MHVDMKWINNELHNFHSPANFPAIHIHVWIYNIIVLLS